MNIIKLFDIQAKLDEAITTEKGLIGANLLNHKIAALDVELAELLNETRCFKYWSEKGPAEKSVILEEYADCLHFILSIGLALEIEISTKNLSDAFTVFDRDMINQYMQIKAFLVVLWDYEQPNDYFNLLREFIRLGAMLGFTWSEIEQAYINKNEINYKRLESGY